MTPTRRPTPPRRPSGFTLIEMVVVLAILAIVATLAVRSVEGRVDQANYETTQRQLRELEEAILGPLNLRQPDGSLSASGFVSDMGRLPFALDDGAAALLQPKELWLKPAARVGFPELASFDIRQSTNANIKLAQKLPLPATPDPTILEPKDELVYVPCGWRGPYLQLPVGAPNLRDGWGNPFRMLKASSLDLADVDTQAAQYLSRGADNAPGGTGYDLDVGVSIVERLQGAISGNVEVTVKAGDTLASVKVRLYGPDSNTGFISVIEQEVANPNAIPATGATVSIPFIFDKSVSTIGTRILKAYYSKVTGGTFTAGNSTTIVVPPGGLTGVTLRFNP